MTRPPREPVAPAEIERRWLVDEPPADLSRYPCTDIAQGYLAVGADGREVRLRRRGGRCWLTAKRGEGLVRAEAEVELDAERFDRLWPLTAGARLAKRRHEIPLDGVTAELDVFAGSLAGLYLVEVEFPDRAAAAAFAPPPWCGREVTEDARYRNRALAIHGRPDR